ncbi:MAG TPA: tripartite tricarboxylate transporter substrate binding protein [Burkholderiales bacterium]|nr:tripartite tricarboxylate transporter substrate binding protein [Burkholderiales bacterium]
MLATIVASAVLGAHAQTFPSKPVRIVVPFPPGGAADITSRVLGEQMSQGLGQPVVIENRPGGSTIIGAEAVLRSAPDGYTVFVVFPSFIINPSVRPGMSFHPLKDFRAVGHTVNMPMTIAVHPSVPASTLQDLIDLARSQPGKLAYGTPGIATTHHVMGELLNLTAKVKLTHAPFQGGAPALTAVTGGHIQMIYANTTEVVQASKAGRIRPLVVTSAERSDVLADVPTMKEAGYPQLEAYNWSGMVVPSATPLAAINRLNSELVRALALPAVREKFKTYGMDTNAGTPQAFDAFLRAEFERYGAVVREAGIKAD